MPFEVQLEQYAGPLQLLLELIEKRKLPITDVSLAQVTEDFLRHMEAREPPPEELADFLVIATRLLLIKSYEILPKDEPLEDAAGPSLASQLELYQQFVHAADLIDQIQQSPARSFPRAFGDTLKNTKFEVPEELDRAALHGVFEGLLKRLEPFFKIQRAALERVVSVKERLAEIRDALLARSKMTFRDMIGAGRSKVDIVVSFLALLELVKQRTVHTVQSGHFGDIEVHRID